MRATRVRLPDVDLHCFEGGTGPLVLLAHGFPDEPMTYARQLDMLVTAGFRVAAPTMRGYAPSGEPRSGRYTISALGDDLVALAEALSPDAKVHLVGHDWGAIAAFSAAAVAPERFATLTTMAVPHAGALLPHFQRAEQIQRSWYIGMFQLPIIAERRLARDDLALVERLFRDWSPGYEPSVDELDAIKAAIRPRVKAVLAYYRALRSPAGWFGEDRERMFARVEVPALHIHGAEDGCIGIECCEGAEAFYDAPFRMLRIEGAGHFVTRERPEIVSDAILELILATG